MRIEENEIQDKIQELLLNRVTNLKWAFFDLDLNKAFKDFKFHTNEKHIISFFKSINKSTLGKYEYKGNHSEADILKVLFSVIKAIPRILKSVLLRLFDINEIPNDSGAEEGNTGKFNRKDRVIRNKIYKDKIRKGT
jgi:hypothetical protein